MSQDDFSALYQLVLPFLPMRDERKSEYQYPEILLAVVRLLAEGCTFASVARFIDMSKSAIEHYLDAFLLAIVKAVQSTKGQGGEVDCSISFPQTAAELEAELQRWVTGRDRNDQRYAALRGCIGAGDGTLIPVLIKKDPTFNIEAHRSRKGDGVPYYNCMAITGARGNFMYFNVGAEGCAHDSQVLAECHPESLLPPNTFILFDAGGPLIRHKVLTPYKGRDLMYHLRELRFDGSPLEQDQLFNLRHSVKRSGSVECAFGLLKGKWRILKRGIHTSRRRAHLILFACVSLHNFLVIQRGHGKQDLADAAEGYEPIYATPQTASGPASSQSATQWRDDIARMMHTQYLAYLAQRDADGADLTEAQEYEEHALKILETNDVGPSIHNYLQHFS